MPRDVQDAIIATMSADIRSLERTMKRATAVTGNTATGMERRWAAASKNMADSTETAAVRVTRQLATMSTALTSIGRVGLIGGVATAVGGIGTAIAGTARGIAEMNAEAARAGVGVEQFQALRYVAEQSKVSFDAVTDGLKELNIRADEFIKTGAGSGAEAFKRLGLSAEELRAGLQDPADLMLKIIGLMEGLDGAAQIRISDEIFGGEGGEQFVQLIAQGEAGLRASADRARELGVVMDAEIVARAVKLDQRFTEITTRLTALGKALTIEVGLGLQQAIDNTTREIAAIEAVLNRLRSSAGEQDRSLATAETLGADPTLIADADTANAQALAAAADNARAQWAAAAAEAIKLSDALMVAADESAQMGFGEQALEIERAATEMRSLGEGLQAGKIEAGAFEDAMNAVLGEVRATFSAMGDVNGVSFSAVVAQAGALGGAMRAAAAAAREAGAAIAAAAQARAAAAAAHDVSAGRAASNARRSERMDRPGDSPAPRPPPPTAPGRPTTRPDDIDFGYNPPARSGRSGGGGGSGGSGGGGGGGGGAPAYSIKDLLAEGEAEIEQIERRMEAIGKTAAEVAELEARYKLLDLAKAKGLALDAKAGPAGETLRQQIDAQAAAIGAMTAQYENAQERAEAFERAQEDITSQLLDAIEAGESLGDVLKNLAIQYAEAAIKAALLKRAQSGQAGQGGQGGGQGGDIIGTILGAIAGSGSAGGTGSGVPPTTSVPNFEGTYEGGGFTGSGMRTGGIDGRGGFPAILHPNETVIDHTRQRGGGSSASQAVHVEVVSRAEPGTTLQVVDARIANYDRRQAPATAQSAARDPRRVKH